MKAVLAALVITVASAAFAGDFGVTLEVDVPLDPVAIAAFPAYPMSFDLVTLRAFYEWGAWGAKFDLESSKEARLGVYRRMQTLDLGVVGYEATLGAYAGYNWRGDGWFFRLRGRILLYGSL